MLSNRSTILFLAAASLCLAQAVPDPALLLTGRQLVAELKLDQAADNAMFQQIGVDRATAILTAVMNRGQENTASASEWTEMHRAIAGLIELYAGKGEFFRASLFANFQSFYYRHDEADYTAALAASRQALDLQQKSGMAETLYICWMDVGDDLMRLGRLDEGLDADYEAHRIIDNPVSSLAGILWRTIVNGEVGRKRPAVAHRELSAFLRQSETGAALPLFRGQALLAQADVEMQEGRPNEALNAIAAAAKVVTDPKDATGFGYETTNELMTLALVGMESLPYAEAMALLGRIEHEFPNLPFPMAPFARQIIDYRRRLAGDFDALLSEDIAELEKARQSKDVREQIDTLGRLAVTYSFANNTRQQITLLEQAVALERSLLPASGIPDDRTSQTYFFRRLNNLGSAYVGEKQIDKARKCYEEVIRGIDGLRDAAAKANLGRIYGNAVLGNATVAELDDEPDRARDILKQALGSPTNGPAKFTRSDVLLQAARLERNLNERPLDAVAYYEDAIREVHAAKDTRTEISMRLQLGRYLAVEAAKKVPDAQRRAAEHLKLAEGAAGAIEFAEAQWRVRFLEGIVAENSGQTGAAIAFYTQAVARLDQLRAGLPQQEQRQAFMDNESIQELYSRLTALLTGAGRKGEAWEYLERGKARAFLEGLQGRRFRSSSPAGSTGDLEALEKQIVNLRVVLAPGNKGSRGSGTDPALVRTELQRLEANFAAARQEAATVSSRAAQPLSLRPISLADAGKSLPAHAALVEYAVLDGAMTAFIVTASSAAQIRWEMNTKTLTPNIQQLRDLMANPSSGDRLQPLLKEVSALLVDPVVKALPAGIDRLLIVPSQSLYYIPFQALLLPDGRSMVDRFIISYLPSASTLQFLKPGKRHSTEDLFLGALGNVSVDGMAPLPATLTETAGIANLYPRAQRFTEREFTHDRAVQALLEHEQVHFATHGLFEAGAPLFSALLVGGAGGPSRLSLYEVMDLKLRARLVVLSACETNRGKLMGGDEVAGLTRTFLLAGAETVVSSLWQVSDEATALLMQNFYRRLRTGQSPAAALRESEIEVRKQFPHPFYWAPFVETGVD